jgi:hypothetical protein
VITLHSRRKLLRARLYSVNSSEVKKEIVVSREGCGSANVTLILDSVLAMCYSHVAIPVALIVESFTANGARISGE